MTSNFQVLNYAEVTPKTLSIPPPKVDSQDRVTYVPVWADAVVPPLHSDSKKKPGTQTVSLSAILMKDVVNIHCHFQLLQAD